MLCGFLNTLPADLNFSGWLFILPLLAISFLLLISFSLDVFNLKHVDWSTGSLGHALGVAIGLAIANPKKKMWVIVGDGEMDE